MWRLAALFLILLPGVSLAVNENDVLGIAIVDARKLPDRETQLVTRYIWITDTEWETIQATSLVLNYWSRGTNALRAMPIGKNVLVRVDLRHYAPRFKDLKEILSLWEEFRFEPRFNLLLTKDTLKFVGVDLQNKAFPKKKITKTKKVLKDCDPYVHADGNTYSQKWVEEVVIEEIDEDVLRVIGEHIDLKLLEELIDITGSQAPIVTHGYFLTRSLTTIKGKGVFKTIYGGLYYELSGIKKDFKKGTDLDNFLDELGIGNVEQGINAEQVFDKRRSDQRIARFKSGVTGKVRAVDLFRQLTGKIGDNQAIVSITHDIKDDDVDIGSNYMLNLLPGTVKDRAREIIFEKANGLHGFVLFDGDGKLQEVVPPDVTIDTTIPSPYGGQLQPAISCLRCHKKQGGWLRADNDVKRLLGRKLDVFGDASQRRHDPADLADRLYGLYSGDIEFKVLPRARDDYAAGILRCTGVWKNKDQLDLVKISGDKIAALFAEHNYTPIGASKVLKDLGEVVLNKEKSHEQLEKLIPPVNVIIGGITPEDGRIAALKAGLEISRIDYDLIYSFLVNRYQKEKARLKLLEKK